MPYYYFTHNQAFEFNYIKYRVYYLNTTCCIFKHIPYLSWYKNTGNE